MTKTTRGRVRRGLAILLTLGLLTTLAGTSVASAATRKACKKGFARNKAGKCVRKKAATTKQPTATTKATATTAKPATAAKGVIKLGQLYSGIVSSTGAASLKEAQKMGQVWENQVNSAGGINGYKVTLLQRDTANDSAKALQHVKDLDRAGVLALIGNDAAAQIPVVVPYLNDKQLPWIGGVPYADESDWDPMVFPTGASEWAGRYGQVAAARDVGAKRFLNAWCTEVAACQGSVPVTREAAQREGLGFESAGASAVATDYTSLCLSAKQKGVDFFQSNGLNFANVVRDCSRQNYHPTYAQGGAANQAFIDASKGESAAGNLFEVGIFYNGPEVAEFKAALAKTDLLNSNTPPGQTSVQAWLGLKMAEAIIRKLTQPNPTRQDFLNATYSVKGETLGGMTFPVDYTMQRPGTGLHAPNDCWTEHLVQDGKLYHMNTSGQIVNKLTFICGTGHTYTIKKP